MLFERLARALEQVKALLSEAAPNRLRILKFGFGYRGDEFPITGKKFAAGLDFRAREFGHGGHYK